MVHPNVKVVEDFFCAYKSRDLIKMKQLFSDSIVWHIPGHHPLSGIKKGADEVLAYFSLLQKANFTVEMLFLEANEKFVTHVNRGFSSYANADIDILWIVFWEIEEGKIMRARNFPEDQHAADNFFWKLYDLKPLPDRLVC